MDVSKSRRYMIGASIFIGYTLFAMSWKTGDLLISGFGYGANDIGTMTGMIQLAKVITSILIAAFVASLAASKVFRAQSFTLTMGLFCLSAALILLPMNQSFVWLASLRVIVGIGGALVLYAMNPLVSAVFPDNELPAINGLNSSGFNLGFALAVGVASWSAYNSKITLYIIAVALACCGVLLLFNTHRLFGQAGGAGTSSATVDDGPGVMAGFKSGFNWLFALTFTGLISVYYVSATFLDADVLGHVLYAGIAGNLLGAWVAGKLDKLRFVKVMSICTLILLILFVAFRQSAFVEWIALLLGFSLFLPIAAFITLGFEQKGVTPSKIAITFTILWIVSDLLSTGITKISGYLWEAYPGNTASYFVIAVFMMYPVGIFLFPKK